jgi:hypothetical protein
MNGAFGRERRSGNEGQHGEENGAGSGSHAHGSPGARRAYFFFRGFS